MTMPTFPRNLLTLRFSLRAMLVVVTVACLALGWRANRLWQNQRALTSLTRSGINVFLGGPDEVEKNRRLSFWNLVDVDSISLIHIKQRDSYDANTNLWTDVSRLTPLESLTAQGADLPRRSDLWSTTPTSIRDVTFYFCRFQGDSFRVTLEQIPRLRSLSLSACELDTKSLTVLSTCDNLETLTMRGISLSPDVIATIGGRLLRRLKLESLGPDCRIELSAADIRAISQMTRLEELHIGNASGAGISALELKALGQLKSLKLLNLSVDDSVRFAEMFDAEIELARALPNCEVQIMGGRF